MKNNKIFIVIATLSLVVSFVAFCFDQSEKKYPAPIAAIQIFAMAFLLFIFISINFIAIRFCIKQLGKAIKKNSG